MLSDQLEQRRPITADSLSKEAMCNVYDEKIKVFFDLGCMERIIGAL